MEPRKYSNLLDYIDTRNSCFPTTATWCAQLRLDEAEAVRGGFHAVAEDLQQAQADFAAAQEDKGQSGFPYNRGMGEFLGLPITGNGEPAHGYYMARCVMSHHRLGKAQRQAQALILAGKCLRVTTARDSRTRKPIRFAKYTGPTQIIIEGDSVRVTNGKRGMVLRSNWATETALEALVVALETGEPYGTQA